MGHAQNLLIAIDISVVLLIGIYRTRRVHTPGFIQAQVCVPLDDSIRSTLISLDSMNCRVVNWGWKFGPAMLTAGRRAVEVPTFRLGGLQAWQSLRVYRAALTCIFQRNIVCK